MVHRRVELESCSVHTPINDGSPPPKLLETVLYGVAPNDPLTFAAVAALLGGVSIVASYLPARCVTLVDPIVAMRTE